MSNQTCLERGRLKEYLAGWVDEQQSLEIEAHLADCEVCEQTVSGLEADPDTLVQNVRVSSVSSENGNGPESSVLLDTLKAIGKRVGIGERGEQVVQLPSELGVYQLLEPLGSGGMGAVYHATHRQLGKSVALKLLPPQAFQHAHHAARFQREMKAAGGLEHQAIVRATDAGEVNGIHFLAMEYIDGLDLSKLLRSQSQLGIADACEIVRQVAMGLAHAHSEGIVHRDIKPSNLMLNREGQIKILDFGLARIGPWDEVSAELTTVGQLMGTIDYMAPEQAERAESVDYRADLFSLGATFYKLLTGRSPLAVAPGMSPLAKLRMLASFESPNINESRSDVPKEVAEVISAMLESNPNARPTSASQIASKLSPFAEGHQLQELIKKAAAAGSNLKHHSQATSEIQAIALTAQDAKGNNRTRSWWSGLALAMLVPLFLAAGVLFTLELQKGQLVIDSEVPVSVELRQDGESVKRVQVIPGATTTKLYAGRYQVVIQGGSDSLSIADDGWITIERGDTQLAKILQKPKGSGQEIARDDAELRPGQVIQVESFSMPEINRTVTVSADKKIRLPLIGGVSVQGDTLDSLVTKLEREYEEYANNPDIQLFNAQVVIPTGAPAGMATAAENRRIPPASTAKLQPGDRLEIVFYQAEDLNRTVVVQADTSVRLPLIGTLPVAELTVDEFVVELKKRYSSQIRDPRIDVFRVAGTRNVEVARNQPEVEGPSRARPLYEGKGLSDYLATLEYERSDEAIQSALGAISALRSKESNPLIAGELRRILPDVGWTSWQNYYFAILTLRGVDETCDQWILEQLRGATDMRWRKPLVRNCLNDQTEFATAGAIIDVLSETDLAQKTEATTEAVNFLQSLLLNRNGKLQRKAFEALKNAAAVDDEFWLNFQKLIGDIRSRRDRYGKNLIEIKFGKFGELEGDLVDFIISRATRRLNSIGLHDEKIVMVYEAIHILMQNKAKSVVRSAFERHSTIDEIEERLNRILVDQASALQPVAFEARKFTLQPIIDGNSPGEESDWTVELLAAALLPDFSEVSEATRLEIAKFVLVLAADCNGEYRSEDPWSKAEPFYSRPSTRFYSRIEPRLIPRSKRAANLILGQCFTASSRDATQELLEQYVDRVRTTYLARIFRDISSESKETIGEASLSLLFEQIKLAEAPMEEIDTTGDGLASLPELEAYRRRIDNAKEDPEQRVEQANAASEKANMEEALKYAVTLVKKYDQNRDGKLSEAEWKKMLIKPKGADANGDGFIDAEEYAKYRTER